MFGWLAWVSAWGEECLPRAPVALSEEGEGYCSSPPAGPAKPEREGGLLLLTPEGRQARGA